MDEGEDSYDEDAEGHVADDNVGKFCHRLRQTIWTVAVRSILLYFGKER